jgi:hypothetical protein
MYGGNKQNVLGEYAKSILPYMENIPIDINLGAFSQKTNFLFLGHFSR